MVDVGKGSAAEYDRSPVAGKIVLAEGARPSGQASSIGPSAMQRSADRPSELPGRSVIGSWAAAAAP